MDLTPRRQDASPLAFQPGATERGAVLPVSGEVVIAAIEDMLTRRRALPAESGWLTAGVPALRWADDLEAEARVWARTLIDSNRFAHDPALHGHGENLWTGWGGRVWTPEEMIGEWIAEKANYRHGVFPNVSRTGRWSDVGHYTQLVWRDSTHVGCAIETRGDRSVLACRYAPPGNIDGRIAY